MKINENFTVEVVNVVLEKGVDFFDKDLEPSFNPRVLQFKDGVLLRIAEEHGYDSVYWDGNNRVNGDFVNKTFLKRPKPIEGSWWLCQLD